jgi:hypothetical protein
VHNLQQIGPMLFFNRCTIYLGLGLHSSISVELMKGCCVVMHRSSLFPASLLTQMRSLLGADALSVHVSSWFVYLSVHVWLTPITHLIR